MPNDLTQKYRPKTFEEIAGQTAVVDLLKGMLSEDPLPPAIILHGPSSSGKTTLSRIIPAYSNCLDQENFDPCWKCVSCRASLKMIEGSRPHPDVKVINCAGERGIDMTRNLHEEARCRPRYNYRWFILDECHRLTPDAQENLLTLTEEPPRRTRFILLTTNPEKLKKPLLNRCQSFKLDTVEITDLAKLVRRITKKEKSPLPPKICRIIAEAAEGVPRDALKITEQVLNSTEKGANPKELVLVVKEVTKYSAPALTRAYMEGVFSGNFTLALSAVDHLDNYDFLIARALETIQAAVYLWIDPRGEQLRSYNPELLRNIDIPDTALGRKLLKLGLIQKLLETYIKAQERTKAYLVDSRSIIISSTLEAVKDVNSWDTYRSKPRKKKK